MATTTTTARPHTGPGTPAATTSREDRLDAAHVLLLDGFRQLTTSDAWTRMLTVAARFPNYSTGNVMLILAQRPDATRVAGMKTWNSLGRKVNRGEHGIRIDVSTAWARSAASAPERTGGTEANIPSPVSLKIEPPAS